MQKLRLYSPEGIAAALIFIVLIAVLLVQVLGRTPLLRGPVWTEELARWLWVWMAFIGIGEAERTNSQLRMDLLAGFLGGKARLWLFMAIDVAYLAIVSHLVWIGWNTVIRTWSNASVTLPVPDGMLYLAALVGLLLVLLRIVLRIVGIGRRDGEGIVL
jgi:TRAP-type transport system small permease protein